MLKYYDPEDNNKNCPGNSIQVTFNESYFLQSTNDSLVNEEDTTVVHANHKTTWHRVKHQEIDPELLHPYLGFRPARIIRKTLQNTTQNAKMILNTPLRKHLQPRVGEFYHVKRLDEMVSTDPIFANCRSFHNNYTGCQAFYGVTSHMMNVAGFRSKGEFPNLYRDFLCNKGAPSILRRDNAKKETSAEVDEIHRELFIKDEWSEAYYPNQNPVESHMIRYLKQATHTLLDCTGAPDSAWYHACVYICEIHNPTADMKLKDGMTPYQM